MATAERMATAEAPARPATTPSTPTRMATAETVLASPSGGSSGATQKLAALDITSGGSFGATQRLDPLDSPSAKHSASQKLAALDALTVDGQMNLSCYSTVAKSPKYGFRTKSEMKDSRRSYPGPGTYDGISSEKDKWDTTPQWSIGSFTSTSEVSEKPMPVQYNPGPGQYNPGLNGRIRTGSKWGFGAASAPQRPKHIPPDGPGPVYVLKGGIGEPGNQHQWSMARILTRERHANPLLLADGTRPHLVDGTHRLGTPGPGAHKPSIRHTRPHAPERTFGCSRPATVESKMPGPGDYDFLEALGGSIVHTKTGHYSLRKRTKFGDPLQHSASSGFFPAATTFRK